MREALTAALIAAALLVFAQPAPYVAAPDQIRVVLRGRDYDSTAWKLTPYDEFLMHLPNGAVIHGYANTDNQLVLTNWNKRHYLVPEPRERSLGNMCFVHTMTWEEREAWRAGE